MRKRHTGTLSDEQREGFLSCLSAGMLVAEAADIIGASTTTLYRYRSTDRDFREDWEEAYAVGADALARAARTRAVEGVNEVPIFGKGGMIIGYRRDYSDVLLMMLMKSRDPFRYCDRARTLALEWEKADRDAAEGAADPNAKEAALEAIAALERIATAKAAEAECPTGST